MREWLPYNNYASAELVSPKTCQWSVPTVKRLWFGTNIDDKQRRLRAFLSCLNSGAYDVSFWEEMCLIPSNLLESNCKINLQARGG